jgi:hypothetical protein
MKKKRTITFSLLNYFEESGPEVLKLQGAFKIFSGIVTGATIITSSDRNALISTAVCFVVNEMLCLIKVEEEQPVEGI